MTAMTDRTWPLPKLPRDEPYFGRWQEQLDSKTGRSSDEIEPVAELAEGFSLAYLKQLVIDSVMKWMQSPAMSFADVLETHVNLLSRQMETNPDETKSHSGRPVCR